MPKGWFGILEDDEATDTTPEAESTWETIDDEVFTKALVIVGILGAIIGAGVEIWKHFH